MSIPNVVAFPASRPGASKPPSPETIFGEMAAADANLASRQSLLYRWTGLHWRGPSPEDIGQDLELATAFNWLSLHPDYRARATPALARSCVAAAALMAQPLPQPASEATCLALPVQNGYLHIDLVSGDMTLTEPDPALGMTYVIPCRFDPHAQAPRFERFLQQVLPDQATRDYVRAYAGYTLLYDCRFQIAIFFLGSGSNGKSTFAQIIAALHHREQCVAMKLGTLDGFGLSQLVDATLVVVDETPQRINEQAIKTLISGGLTQADRKYMPPIRFYPHAKWILCGNNLPAISDHSHGFWRRLPIVPFTQRFSPSEQDPMLAEVIIREELSGVLTWAIEGLIRVLRDGKFPVESQEMANAKHAGQTESNSVLAWWNDDRAAVCDTVETPRRDVYGDYRTWTAQAGVSPLSTERFWNRLAEIIGRSATVPRAKKIDGQSVRVVQIRLTAPSSDGYN